jgi:uncharacterized protein YegP (UPF0339 family)
MTAPLIIKLIDFQGAMPSADGRWRWRTRCPENGNILAISSEHYHNRANCVAMIHRHFGPGVEIVEVRA